MTKLAMMLCIALGIAGLVVVSPASGDPGDDRSVKYWTMGDAKGDGQFGIDIESTSLSIGTPGYYTVKIEGYELTRERLDIAEVYLDVNGGNPGPEYRVTRHLNPDRDGYVGKYLNRVDSWGGGFYRSCPRLTSTVDYARDIIRFAIPRACVNNPPRVRWNVVTWNVTEYYQGGGWYGYYDAIPRWHAFASFWVA